MSASHGTLISGRKNHHLCLWEKREEVLNPPKTNPNEFFSTSDIGQTLTASVRRVHTGTHLARSTQWLCGCVNTSSEDSTSFIKESGPLRKEGRASKKSVGPVTRRWDQQERKGAVKKMVGPKLLDCWNWSLCPFPLWLWKNNRDLGHLGQGHVYLLPCGFVTGQET